MFTDGTQIRQGAGPMIAYLSSGNKLDDFFSVGIKNGKWVDQIHVSGGAPELANQFLDFLRFLKAKDIQLEMDTNGYYKYAVQVNRQLWSLSPGLKVQRHVNLERGCL